MQALISWVPVQFVTVQRTCQQLRAAEVIVGGPAPVAAERPDAHGRRGCRRRRCIPGAGAGGGRSSIRLGCGCSRQLLLLLVAQAALATPGDMRATLRVMFK